VLAQKSFLFCERTFLRMFFYFPWNLFIHLPKSWVKLTQLILLLIEADRVCGWRTILCWLFKHFRMIRLFCTNVTSQYWHQNLTKQRLLCIKCTSIQANPPPSASYSHLAQIKGCYFHKNIGHKGDKNNQSRTSR